jgi:hypothetical protein
MLVVEKSVGSESFLGSGILHVLVLQNATQTLLDGGERVGLLRSPWLLPDWLRSLQRHWTSLTRSV